MQFEECENQVNCNIFIDNIDIQDYNSWMNVIFNSENYLLWKNMNVLKNL